MAVSSEARPQKQPLAAWAEALNGALKTLCSFESTNSSGVSDGRSAEHCSGLIPIWGPLKVIALIGKLWQCRS